MEIYIGTRESVYYRNNSMSDWEIFNLNLPQNTYSTISSILRKRSFKKRNKSKCI